MKRKRIMAGLLAVTITLSSVALPSFAENSKVYKADVMPNEQTVHNNYSIGDTPIDESEMFPVDESEDINSIGSSYSPVIGDCSGEVDDDGDLIVMYADLYNILSNGTAEIYGISQYISQFENIELIIPSEINGIKVSGVSSDAFYSTFMSRLVISEGDQL